jgi:hypothetical protein
MTLIYQIFCAVVLCAIYIEVVKNLYWLPTTFRQTSRRHRICINFEVWYIHYMYKPVILHDSSVKWSMEEFVGWTETFLMSWTLCPIRIITAINQHTWSTETSRSWLLLPSLNVLLVTMTWLHQNNLQYFICKHYMQTNCEDTRLVWGAGPWFMPGWK